MPDDIVEILRRFADAYPESVFPTPPEDQRAKDAAAADVMRVMALPWFEKAADEIERLRAEVQSWEDGKELADARPEDIGMVRAFAEEEDLHPRFVGRLWRFPDEQQ